MAQVRESSRWVQVVRGVWLTLMMAAYARSWGARAAEYEVGGSSGWVVGAVNYSLWSANHSFFVGDFLVFKYLKEFHSVLEVTKESYERCNATSPISEHHNGNTRLRLREARSFYFICGVYKHCPLGQKLAVSPTNPPSHSNKSKPGEAPPHNLMQDSPPPSIPVNSSSSSCASLFGPLNYHALSIPLVLAFFTFL